MVVTILKAVLAAGAVTIAQAPAPGAPPAAGTTNEAGKLFDKARAAFKAGNYAEACPAFEQSYTLEPALGTLLNLGACLEKKGQFASAWLRYNDAVGWAQRTHEVDREQYARKLSADIKPKVSWLTISSADDVDVKIDQQPVRVTPTPISLPVDPGLHALVAEKPGYERWSSNFEIVQPGTTTVQKVPQLKPGTLAAALPPPPPTPALSAPPIVEAKESKDDSSPWAAPPPQPNAFAPAPAPATAEVPLAATPVTKTATPAPSSTRSAGLALIVGGSLVTVAGVAGMAWSLSTYSALQNQRVNVLPPTSFVSHSDYDTLKWAYPVSWVALGAGAAGIITGAVLTTKKEVVTVTPAVTPNGAAVMVGGQF